MTSQKRLLLSLRTGTVRRHITNCLEQRRESYTSLWGVQRGKAGGDGEWEWLSGSKTLKNISQDNIEQTNVEWSANCVMEKVNTKGVKRVGCSGKAEMWAELVYPAAEVLTICLTNLPSTEPSMSISTTQLHFLLWNWEKKVSSSEAHLYL